MASCACAGGTGVSNDHIEIFRSAGNTITVAVNVGNDVAGTGALPGAGNLPAFTSVYDVGQVSQIIVDAGDGNDTIVLDDVNFDPGTGIQEPITINAGNGNDTLIVDFFNANLDSHTGAITFNGGSGTDDVTIFDNAATFNDTYTLTSTALTRTVFGGFTYSSAETLFLNAESGSNIFNINSTPTGTSWSIDGRNGNDTFNVTGASLLGAVNVTGNNGTDALNYNDSGTATARTYTVNSTQVLRSGGGATTYGTVESMTFNAGTANDVISFTTELGSVPSIVSGNASADSITYGNTAFDPPPVTINGDAGNDSFTANVTQSTSNITPAVITNSARIRIRSP